MAAGKAYQASGLKGIGAASATVVPTIMATGSPNSAAAAAAGDDHGGPENA